MHERTRRAVARLLFVLCCAMPTLVTMFVVMVTFTPWFGTYRRERLERELSQRLGLLVEIGKVEYPAPATVRLTNVRLLEPETKAKVADVYLVTWVTTDDKTAVRLSQPELQSSMLPFAWRAIHERFLCQPDLTAVPVRMAADDLTIHSRTGSTTLRDVDTWLRPVESGVEAMIQCVPADRSDSAAVHISVVRNRADALPSTDWTMNTGDVPLNCSAIADYFPSMKKLGPDATFQGTMRWRLHDNRWSIDLGSSLFANVDLGELTQGMSHRLTGNSSIRLERCQIEPGQELDVSGTLTGGAGFVSQSLLTALRRELQFEINPAIEADIRDVVYESLAVRFDFFGSGMTLVGICNKQRGFERLPQDIVFASNGVPLLASGPTQQSWVGLVRSMWAERTEALPVSTQTAWLFEFLPPPQSNGSEIHGAGSLPPRITASDDYQGTPAIKQP